MKKLSAFGTRLEKIGITAEAQIGASRATSETTANKIRSTRLLTASYKFYRTCPVHEQESTIEV
jgi:hypothetical protein